VKPRKTGACERKMLAICYNRKLYIIHVPNYLLLLSRTTMKLRGYVACKSALVNALSVGKIELDIFAGCTVAWGDF